MNHASPDNHAAKPPLSWQERLRQALDAFLNDETMIILALLLALATLLPEYVAFSPVMLRLFDWTNTVIMILFVVEYAGKLLVAETRWAFVRQPWHLLDLLIILLVGVDVCFNVSIGGAGRVAPLLRLSRLLRFFRWFAIAGRTVHRSSGFLEVRVSPPPALPRQMTIRFIENAMAATSLHQDELAEYLHSPAETWIDIQGFSEQDGDFISDALGISKYLLSERLIQESFPRLVYAQAHTTIYLRDARLLRQSDAKEFVISMMGVVIICAQAKLLTICAEQSDLFDRILQDGLSMPNAALNMRILHAILKRTLRDYEAIVHVLERKTTLFEEETERTVSDAFLRETFVLRRQIQKVLTSLWHFRQVLAQIHTRKVALGEIQPDALELFALLHSETEYLYETLANVKDSLISLIELHINTVSFEMNRVMKILAVLTCLSMIPAMISGLLGQNLIDQPFHITFPEIVFLTVVLMLIGVYAFWRKGWLR